MNVSTLNELLAEGKIDSPDMWPRISEYHSKSVLFEFEFGLKVLPIIPGMIIVRGPRQFGKSTWLDLSLRKTIEEFGPGTAFYLNGDEIASSEELSRLTSELIPSFKKGVRVKRLFIDEITAIPGWEKVLKRLWDQGELREILVVTTGSKAFDLRRGAERLPGRKGKLEKTNYVFLPISYEQFHKRCSDLFKEKTWMAYLITGGSPVLCHDLYQHQKLTESSVQITRDWVLGEIIASGRSRVFIHNLFQALFRFGGTPVGFAKLARESGLANNTLATEYIEQLSDLFAVLPSWQWDDSRQILVSHKPCKFNFINLGVAIAFHKSSIRSLSEFENQPTETKGMWLEWLVAQEIWRRTTLSRSEEEAEQVGFWKSKEHEIDFVTPEKTFIEVKWGRAGPLDFTWFPKVFPKSQLLVVCKTPFETNHIRGVTPEEFLLPRVNDIP